MAQAEEDFSDILSESVQLVGFWDFKQKKEGNIVDLSGKAGPLSSLGISKPKFNDSCVSFNGKDQWLETSTPVIDSTNSFSVVSWIRLDSDTLNGNLALENGNYAVTALSQDSPSHSIFYLGVRTIIDENKQKSLYWNFTVSPIDGSETGSLEWQHAHAKTALNNQDLDKWVMLVGVCDVLDRCSYIFIPGSDEVGVAYMPDAWEFWDARGGLQIGKGKWLGRNVDFWPGSVAHTMLFSGALTEADAMAIYRKNKPFFAKL